MRDLPSNSYKLNHQFFVFFKNNFTQSIASSLLKKQFLAQTNAALSKLVFDCSKFKGKIQRSFFALIKFYQNFFVFVL
jgi:hypothetical protein